MLKKTAAAASKESTSRFAPEVSNASFVIGNEFAADPPSNTSVAIPRRQLELHVMGSTTRPHQHYHIKISVFVRGALWRTFTASLCTSLMRPSQEIRECDKEVGKYLAQLWLVVPRFALTAAGERLRALPTREARLLAARAQLLALDVCAPRFGLPAAARPKACNARAVSPVELMVPNGTQRSAIAVKSVSNMFPNDWELMGATFLMAAQTLPQPFTVVESGNLCGGATVFFALLKKVFCPACPFHSRDPGMSRTRFRMPMDCAEESARLAGVDADVNLANTIGAAVTVDIPVGFVFLDDGKARFANDPVMSYLHEHMLVGGIVLMDDAWQGEPMPHSDGHWGQAQYANELLQSGDYTGLAFPKADYGRAGLGFSKSRGWKGQSDLPASALPALERAQRQAPTPAAFGDQRKLVAVQRARALHFAARASAEPQPAEPLARVRVTLSNDEGADPHSSLWVDVPNIMQAKKTKRSRGATSTTETSANYWRVVG